MSSKVDKALEKYKKKKQNEQNESPKNNNNNSKNKVDAALEKYRQKTDIDETTAQKLADSFIEKLNNFSPNSSKIFDGKWHSADEFSSYDSAVSSLLSDGKKLHKFYSRSGATDAAKAMKEQIDSLTKYSDDLSSTWETYSNYKNEDEFNKALEEQKQAEEEYNFYKNYDVDGTSNRLSVLETVYRGLEYSSSTDYDTYVKQKDERYKKVYDEYIKNYNSGISTPSSANAGQLLQNQQLHSPYAASANRNGVTKNPNELAAEAHKAAASDPTVKALVEKINAIDESKALSKKYGIDTSNPDALKTEIDTLQREWKNASRIQKGIKLQEEAIYAEDFEEYAKKGEGLGVAKDPNSLNNVVAFRSDPNFIEDYENAMDNLPMLADSIIGDQLTVLAAKHFTEQELMIYNYHFAKDKEKGTDSANAYLKSMQEVLSQREGNAIAKTKNTWLERTAYGFEVGLDNYVQSVKNYFNFRDDYIPYSSTQVAGGIVREDLAETGFKIGSTSLGQIGYDITNTTGNMAPSIAVSFVPGAGPALMATSVGISAAGSSYQEALNAGYSRNQARIYANLNGASEATLSLLLNGAGKATGKLTGKSIEGLTSKIKSAGLKTAAKLGVSAGGEFLEENLQAGLVEPVLSNAILGTDKDIDLLSEEALYNGFLGAATSLILGSPSAIGSYTVNSISNAIATRSDGKQIIEAGKVGDLVNFGKALSADTVAYKLANKVDENTGAYKVGKLLHEAGAESLSATNMADIQKSLVRKGLTEKDASNIATWLNKAVEGEIFTEEQIEILDNNEAVSQTFKDVIFNQKSTVNQRIQGYNSLLGLAYEMENVQAPTNEQTSKPSEVAENSELASNDTNIETNFNVSEDGKTTNASTGETITINKNNAIAKTETVDGERVVYLNTDKGVVSSKDVNYASESEALVYESFVDLNPAYANAVIKNYDGKTPVQTYVKGMREGIVLYGMHNFQGVGKDISSNTYFAELSDTDQAFALKLGREYAEMVAKKHDSDLRTSIKNAAEKAESNKDTSTKATAKKGKVRFEKGVKAKGKLQKRTVALAKHLSSAIGIDIVFHDARTTTDPNFKDEDGNLANGYYDLDTDTIHLDLQNAKDDAKTIAYTLSHELGHFIKKWSLEKYNTFAKFLMENYAKHGVNTSELLANKMAELGTKDADYAYEEMIADACETMLLDSNAVYKLMELRKTDLDLFEKIKLHLHELLTKIRNMYKELGLQPTSDEAKALLKMQDSLEQIYALFEEAAVDAAQTYQAVQNANETVFGEEVVEVSKTESGVKNQLKNHKKIGEDATAYNDRHKNVHNAILKVGIESMYEMAETMLPYLGQEGILPPDIPGKTIFKNGSYGKTGENTTLCVRTLTYEDFKNRVAEEVGRPLTVSESLLVSQKIYDIATDPQCIYCYVAADRKAYDGYLGEYWKSMDKYIKAMRKGGDSKALYTEYLAGRKDTDAQKKRWSQWEAIAKSGKDYISAKDLTTKNKRDALIAKKNAFSEQIKDAQRYAQSASWAKTVFDYRAYKGDILKMTSKFVDMLNSEYGLRMYSFSDYTPAFIVENMQMLIDASVKGLKSLAYTKDTDYAEIFASTGQAINVSCFAKWDAESGTFVEDNRQGANWAKTKSLRKQYRNVGAVMVATNDAMVEWALKQDWVDVVIPYHIVKTGTTIANEYQWNNYTSESADRVGNKTANIYPTEHNNDFATYSNLLNERGITPRFSRWYDMVESGKLTEEQYMKLVNEVRLPASELSAVVPSFNLEAAKNSFGIDNEGNVIKGGFVDKGGYMGGWYRQGVDVNQEVMAVSEDIKAGKSSLDVDYGMSKAAKEKAEARYKKQAKKKDVNPYQGKTMYTDSDIYNYEFLTSLDPMKVETMPPLSLVKENGKVSQDKAIKLGLENAESIGRRISDNQEQYAIKNAYTKREIILGRKGLNHSLDASEIHRLRTNARLSAIGAYIVQNAVPINGLKKENQQANGTYAMACLVNDGKGYVVAIVTVDEFDSTVVGIDVVNSVHSINGRFLAKKEDSRSSSRESELGQESISATAISTINIADFLEIVNSTHRSILSNDVLQHFDVDRPSEGHYANRVLFQKKTPTNRELLSNALESAIDTSTQAGKYELKLLKEYQTKIESIEKEEAHLAEVNAEIKEISFGKDTDRSKLKDLKFEKTMTQNRIHTYDKQLMRLEAMKPMKDILTREKEMVRKRTEEKGKAALAEYRKEAIKVQKQMIGEARRETRQKISESRQKTEAKAKIQKVVSELNQLLLNGTKDKHVTEGLQKAVAMALDAFNMDTVGADKRVAKYNALIAKATDPDVIASLTETRDRIQKQGDRMSDKLTKLKDAYNDIIKSSDPNTANVYDKVIANYIESAVEKVGNTSLRDMSIDQLDTVYSVYKMVLTTVRNFNKAFKMAKAESISSLGNKVMMEVEKVGGSKTHVLGGKLGSALSMVKKFDFNNLKPVYAFERIGSNTLSKLFENVRKGEDVWAVDVTEAKDFKEETASKYNYKKWDFDKVYSFKTSTGTEFSLSLDQIMSLYAYSKRDQALPHLAEGGFVFDSNIETHKETVKETKDGKKTKKSFFKYKVNTATAHKISPFEVADIVGKLTAEQKAFVDEMQKYLSDVMGAKGNEVALEMYGVKLFKEKHYFPLKSANQYMFEQNEVAGEVKIKNSSFSKETVKHANNPVILSNFMDVWANHVNDMSMYHAFVLPLEDFNRVFNYNTPSSQSLDKESVKGFIQNAYGRHANEYISQLIKDLNGGARVDPRESVSKNMIGKFKKASVFGSASVVIQQPSAIGRALAVIGAKYFDFNPKLINHNKLWTEVKKYAPVAIIKEMGHFDTDMGSSTVDYIKGESRFMEKVDNVISKPASYMDELTWVHIWTAVKREVKANNKDLSGEAYLQKCGERFTEVVTKTQVYDSVLSRSANMRSKSVFMNMLTSFMAEPTTAINMLEDAMTKISRGQKGKGARQITSVAASVILNSMLVAFVYAARDDDEDETYWEKYIGSLTSEIIDGSNPITYYPILKDIWSIAQGYDVERSDMTLISKAIDSLKNVTTVMLTDTEDMTEEELAEHNQKIVDAWLGVAGEFSSLFGIPAKNLIRDIKAGFNVYNTANNGAEGSWSLLWDEVAESAINTIPILGWFANDSKTDKLYDAKISGDLSVINRLKSGYKDEKAYNTAVRKALRENDPRIKEAAEASYEGDVSTYSNIFDEIISEGNFDRDDIKAAIEAEEKKLEPDEPESESNEDELESKFETEHYFAALIDGDESTAYEVKEDIINTEVANGKEQDEAEESFYNSFKEDCRDGYADGVISRQKTMDMLIQYGGMDNNEAYWQMKKYDYYVANGTTDGYSKYDDFYTSVQTGKNLRSVVQEYTTHGVKSDTLAKQITSYFKPLYREMTNYERAGIKGYLLNAYVLLGKNRYEKSRDIDKWLKD